MSRYAMEWAKWERVDDAEAKLLLLVIADHAEGPTSECIIREANLAGLMDMDRARARAVVDRLAERNLATATVLPSSLDPTRSKREAGTHRHLQEAYGDAIKFALQIPATWRPPARLPAPEGGSRREYNRATAVYRLYDALGVLLYVGVANDPSYRFGQHRMKMPWWARVVTREIEWHETRLLAEAEEYRSIVQDGPVFNVRHMSKSVRTDYSKRQKYAVLDTSPDAFNAALKRLRSELRAGKYDVIPLPDDQTIARVYGIGENSVRSLLFELRKEGELELERGAFYRPWSEW